jgi:glycopeptide antibiotics resistance protein
MKGNGRGTMILAVCFFVLLLIGILVTIFAPISKLNLVWWVPASYLINIYSFRYFNSNSSKSRSK